MLDKKYTETDSSSANKYAVYKQTVYLCVRVGYNKFQSCFLQDRDLDA
jgi:hypothetical protein